VVGWGEKGGRGRVRVGSKKEGMRKARGQKTPKDCPFIACNF